MDHVQEATTTTNPLQFPCEAIEPFLDRYIEYNFGRSITTRLGDVSSYGGCVSTTTTSSTTQTATQEQPPPRKINLGELWDTPLLQAVRQQDETSIFLLLLQDKIMLRQQLQQQQEQQLCTRGSTTTTKTTTTNRRSENHRYKRSIIYDKDLCDETPLHLSVECMNENITKLLLEHCYYELSSCVAGTYGENTSSDHHDQDDQNRHPMSSFVVLSNLIRARNANGRTAIHTACSWKLCPKDSSSGSPSSSSSDDDVSESDVSESDDEYDWDDDDDGEEHDDRHDDDTQSASLLVTRIPSDASAGARIVKLLLQYDKMSSSRHHNTGSDSTDPSAGIPSIQHHQHHSLIEQIDHMGRTPLHIASECGNASIVQFLLEEIEALSSSSVASFGAYNNKKIDGSSCSILNATTSFNRWTALHLGTDGNHLKVVQLLLEHNNNTNNYTSYDINNERSKECKIDDDDVRRHEKESTTSTLTTVVDVNAKAMHGVTALHLAAENGNVQIIRILLSHKDISLFVKDDYGQTPIDYALRRRKEEEQHQCSTTTSPSSSSSLRSRSMIVTLLRQAMEEKEERGVDTSHRGDKGNL